MITSRMEVTPEDLEAVVGGTFDRNHYCQDAYEGVGIHVVTHFIAKDEFWWKGEDIGEKAANSVVFFTAVKGYAPNSLEESIPFWNENHKKDIDSNHGCDLRHLA